MPHERFEITVCHGALDVSGFSLHWVTLHGLVVILGLGTYVFASHTLRQRRQPSAAIAWVISLLLLPYIALPLYLMFGNRKVVIDRRTQSGLAKLAEPQRERNPAPGAGDLASALGLSRAVAFDSLDIHQDGAQALKSLRAMITGAKYSLDICTFILGRDVLGHEIIESLIKRARDGVRVRLLIDGVGYYFGGRPNLARLRAAGAEVAWFVSPLRSALRGRTNLRNHRKMVLGDGHWLWCGGRNLAAEYFVGDQTSFRKKTAWIDLSFDLRGALAHQAQQRFDLDWHFATGDQPADSLVDGSVFAAPAAHGTLGSARLVASGPDQIDDTIYTLLVSGCFTARSRILIATPYFVPDQALMMALTLAARRGIQIDLVLPSTSNHALADIARAPALRELASAGAHVWLVPDMFHAKAFLIDSDLALVGSANLDERSLFINYELMVAFYEPQVVSEFAQWVESQRKLATRYLPTPAGLVRELVEGMVRWVAFQL